MNLRRINVVVGLALLAQGAVMLALSNDLALPITASWATGDPVVASMPSAPEEVFALAIGPSVAAFLLLAAADHLLVAAPRVRTRSGEASASDSAAAAVVTAGASVDWWRVPDSSRASSFCAATGGFGAMRGSATASRRAGSVRWRRSVPPAFLDSCTGRSSFQCTASRSGRWRGGALDRCDQAPAVAP